MHANPYYGYPNEGAARLFHKDVFLPAAIRAQANGLVFRRLAWTGHGIGAIQDESFIAPIAMPLAVSEWTLFEVEYDRLAGVVTKVGIRRTIDSRRDLVLILRPNGPGAGRVVTAWVNRTEYTHPNLDRSLYHTSV